MGYNMIFYIFEEHKKGIRGVSNITDNLMSHTLLGDTSNSMMWTHFPNSHYTCVVFFRSTLSQCHTWKHIKKEDPCNMLLICVLKSLGWIVPKLKCSGTQLLLSLKNTWNRDYSPNNCTHSFCLQVLPI